MAKTPGTSGITTGTSLDFVALVLPEMLVSEVGLKFATAASTGSRRSSADLGVSMGAMVCEPKGTETEEDVLFRDTTVIAGDTTEFPVEVESVVDELEATALVWVFTTED
jgi:hypothetical protein